MTQLWLKEVNQNQLWLRKVDFDLSIKSTVNNGNLVVDNYIRARTIIKQADIDTKLLILL